MSGSSSPYLSPFSPLCPFFWPLSPFCCHPFCAPVQGRMRARVTDGTGGQGWKSGYGGKNHRQQCPDCGAKVARHAAALDQHRFLNENCLTWQFWSKMSAAAQKDDESWHKAMSQEVEASPRGAGSCRRCRRKGRSEVACSESLHCCKLNEIGRGSCLSFCRESQEAEGALRIS